jgi:hypothetical protein
VGTVASALLIAFACYYYSFEARFDRSKAALEAYAASVESGDRSAPISIPRKIGDFTTGDAERLPHGFLFFCDYGNPFDANGIAYSTEPLPNEEDGNDFFTRIEGNWYQVWRAYSHQGPKGHDVPGSQP